jgi:phosphatidate cytidylyltransferase
MAQDLFPDALWPLGLRLSMLLVGAAVVIILVKKAAPLIAERKKGGFEKLQSGLDSLWPRFRVWAVAALVFLLVDGLGPQLLALPILALAVQSVRELIPAFTAGGAPPAFRPAISACAVIIIAASVFGGTGFAAGMTGSFLLLPLWLIITQPPGSLNLLVRVASTVTVALYVGAPLASYLVLRWRGEGFVLVAWVVLVVCLSDVLGMLGGMAFGRNPIAPRLSPGKTLEGLGFALLGGVLGAALVRFALPLGSAYAYYGAALVVSAAGIAGDLAASAIKRAAGLKDFGTILPGHGGLMDRLDSLLYGGPVTLLLASVITG